MNKHAVYDSERIESKEVVIADEHSLPVTLSSEPFISRNLTITINHSGTAHNLFDMRPVDFQPHDIAVVLPDHIISEGECSQDYSITIIIISRTFYEELVNRESFMGYLKYQNQPNFSLNEQQYHKIMTILSTLRLIADSEHPKRHETLANLLDILFYALTRYRGEEDQEQEYSRNTHLFNAFYNLLTKNYQQHHEISWYADKLGLTPKYFSGVVRETTGKSAAQWINEVLILHAKRLLRMRRDMTIQQIAYELGFNGSAGFCRFFKAQTSLRPNEYRKGE